VSHIYVLGIVCIKTLKKISKKPRFFPALAGDGAGAAYAQ